VDEGAARNLAHGRTAETTILAHKHTHTHTYTYTHRFCTGRAMRQRRRDGQQCPSAEGRWGMEIPGHQARRRFPPRPPRLLHTDTRPALRTAVEEVLTTLYQASAQAWEPRTAKNAKTLPTAQQVERALVPKNNQPSVRYSVVSRNNAYCTCAGAKTGAALATLLADSDEAVFLCEASHIARHHTVRGTPLMRSIDGTHQGCSTQWTEHMSNADMLSERISHQPTQT
jgi:hypothetical protein